MDKNKIFLIAASISLLSGCVYLSPQKAQSYRQQITETTPVCHSQRQCDAAWSSARNWILDHCGMKIQNITNDYIGTYTPEEDYPGHFPVGCRVTKDPEPDGSYSLHIRTSLPARGYDEEFLYKKALDFNQTVRETLNRFPDH